MVKFVKNEDLLKAYMRWESAWPFQTNEEAWAEFLGQPTGLAELPPDPMYLHFSWEVPDIGAERVRMLCDSPHWYALLKAMAIKEVQKIFGL